MYYSNQTDQWKFYISNSKLKLSIFLKRVTEHFFVIGIVLNIYKFISYNTIILIKIS